MNTLANDLKSAYRHLIKSAGFTVVAVVTLALAIGTNTAIFSLVNSLALKPIPRKNPEQVVNVYTARQSASRDYRQFAHHEFAALRESREAFSDVAAVTFGLVGIGNGLGEVRRSIACIVSENFFSLMGVPPAAGRFFSPEESRPNAGIPVAIASYPFWQQMGGRADFVGSVVRINHQLHTVVGIAPKGFSGVSAILAPQVYLPIGTYARLGRAFGEPAHLDLNRPTLYAFNVIGRLQPGLTRDSVAPHLATLAQRLAAAAPAAATDSRELQVTALNKFSISDTPSEDGPVGLVGGSLLAMAGIVLLIACVNLANMLFARGTARAREIAVRFAVGATRAQVVRQMMIEGLLLALLGGGLGIALSYGATALLEQSFTGLLGSMNFALVTDFTPDLTAVGATFGLCLLATVVFSLLPALRASRVDLSTALRALPGNPAVQGRWNQFFSGRQLLVVVQMTLSVVLLFNAALFLRGALKASQLDLGFEPRGAAVAEIDYALIDLPPLEAARRQRSILERVQALPGVESAGMSTLVPYENRSRGVRIMSAREPMPAETGANAPRPGAVGIYAGITRGYLDALGVRILQGRDFTDAESGDKNSPGACILDEGIARKLFPQGDALGQRVRYTQPPADGAPSEMEVVGVVSRHRQQVNDPAPARFHVYVPLAHAANLNVHVVARLATRDPATVLGFIPGLRNALRGADPDLPLLGVEPYSDRIDQSISLWIVRLGAVLFGVFGLIALVLAVVGVYGVKAYEVERRTREMGIRLALGAERRDVFALIMKHGAWQTAISVGVGVGLSLLVGRILASFLFGVSPFDLLALGFAAFALGGAALFACYLPARRATKVSPMIALRTE